MDKKTPIYDEHVRLGGKMVSFAGYLLPVQYETGVIKEHMAVRKDCGLFDVSHMGELILEGPDSISNLNMLLTNDYTVMKNGKCRYSPMCNRAGGVVDDLIVYKINDTKFFIVVNAANKDKDFVWMKENLTGDATITDKSESFAQIAIQGPKAEIIMKKAAPDALLPAKYYSFNENVTVNGINCLISRTGYTGEDGFELYFDSSLGAKMWDYLLETGKDDGLIPCGLGARDTLRLEAAMPLYGDEMNDEISPIETGLGRYVKMDKPDFIGKKALIERGTSKITRVGLKATGRGVIREHQNLFVDGITVGNTTSGTFLPYVGYAGAMALIGTDFSEIGTKLNADVRGRMVECEVIPLPFYKRK
jgi:aminomethyltransferase